MVLLKTIVLTGGGTAGHVTPNLALVPSLKEHGWQVVYIGSYQGIERRLVTEYEIPYHGVATGKLRRYRDLENLKDPFRVVKGIAQAYRLLRKLRPALVFSKGGFVGLPVVVAAKALRIPVILHEADLSLGLANRLALPFAQRVAVSFPETLKHVPSGKGAYTGLPIRREVLSGDPKVYFEKYGFRSGKPVLLITGGSSGAKSLNEAIWKNLASLTQNFQIVHLCGKGKRNEQVDGTQGYVQLEYANEEMPHLLAMSDLVVSRAGSNTIFELLALRKPHVLVPLPASQSRGDQLLNAKVFAGHGYSVVLEDEKLGSTHLAETLLKVYHNRAVYMDHMRHADVPNGIESVMQLIAKHAKNPVG